MKKGAKNTILLWALINFLTVNVIISQVQTYYKFDNNASPKLSETSNTSDPQLIFWNDYVSENGLDLYKFDNFLPIEILAYYETLESELENCIYQWNQNGCLDLNYNQLFGCALKFSTDANIFTSTTQYGATKLAVEYDFFNEKYVFSVSPNQSYWHDQSAIFLNNTDGFEYEWVLDEANVGSDYIEFKAIMLHELGHLIGMAHSYSSGAVMESPQQHNNFEFSLTNYDKSSLSTLCSLPGNPTDVNDYITLSSPTNISQNSAPSFYPTFHDIPPTGNYITPGYDWEIKVLHAEGEIVWTTGSTVPYVSWQPSLGILPFGYFWLRNSSGNVRAKVVVSGRDNDNDYHSAVSDLEIINVAGNTISGTLQHDETWSGYINITDNVTVPTNVTLRILPTSNITFPSGKRLIVYGDLSIEGKHDIKPVFDFTSPGTSNGIYCYSGSNVNIDNAVIKNARYGVYSSYATPTIQNTNIENCTYGIYLYQTNNVSGDPIVLNNEITDINYYGIYLYNSGGKIRGNEISNCQRGVYCNYLSSPYLGEVDYLGNNKIYGNTYGIYAYNNSDPFLGRNTCTIQGGNNSLYNNTSWNAYASYNGSFIQAEDTWWGSSYPDLLKISISSVDYTPYLTQSPNQANSNMALSPEESLYNDIQAKLVSSNPLAIQTKEYHYDKKWPLDWKILYIRNLVMVKDYKFAQKLCEDIIDEYPDSVQAFNALNLLVQASKNDDVDSFKEYVSKKTKEKKSTNLYGMIDLLQADFEVTKENKLAKYDNIAEKYKNKEMEETVLFHKFMHNLMEMENVGEARKISNDLDKINNKSELAIEAHRLLGDEIADKSMLPKVTEEENTEVMPEEYDLLGNYPNPFNPTTRISYSMPFVSNVNLTIYDVTGRMIKSFEINSQSAGNHEIVWDATNSNGAKVSSGIYLYKLKAISQEGNGAVFEKVSKLLLLK